MDLFGGEKSYQKKTFAAPRELPKQADAPLPLQAAAADARQGKFGAKTWRAEVLEDGVFSYDCLLCRDSFLEFDRLMNHLKNEHQ